MRPGDGSVLQTWYLNGIELLSKTVSKETLDQLLNANGWV